jgi:hypothetical protein
LLSPKLPFCASDEEFRVRIEGLGRRATITFFWKLATKLAVDKAFNRVKQ